MPTPAHAINNSIDTLGWPHTIVQGGRRKNSPRYSNWRNEVEQKIRGKGWLWKKDGGNLYDAFVLECVDLDDFPVSGASTIRRTQTDDTKPFHKALNELMLDCFKKVRESKNKRKRAIAQEEIAAEAVIVPDADGPEPKRGKFDEGRPVALYVLDPGDVTHHPQNNEWHWDLSEVEKLAVLYESSIDELHVKFSSQLPEGRRVREIMGALSDPAADTGVNQKPGRTTRIRSDDELDAFLRMTQAKPIKLLIILHKKPEDGNNTPPPQGMNATYYFKPGRFDGPEYYDDPLEDSGEEITKRVGGKRGVPRKDHKFEDRLNDIRRRIQRQQDLLASLELKHKAAFPGAIHDTDPGGDLRKKCYGANNALTGAEVIIFRQVVADYLADITTRTAANAGAALTPAQVEAAALAAIKTDIDAGNYAGLPQTIP